MKQVDCLRKGPLRGVLAPLALVVAAALALGACRAPARPVNVVLISVDTLNLGSLAAFSPAAGRPRRHRRHRHLDGLAGRARLFRQAVSTSGWTLPAQASILTGLYPDRHGATRPRGRIRPEAVTLAEQARRHGFETVGFTDAAFLDPVFGFPDGFDRYDEVVRPGWRPALALPRDGKAEPLGSRGATLFDRALAYLGARAPGDRPFLLFLQTYSVHDYFSVHPWAAEALGFCASAAPEGHRYLECLVGNQRCPPEEWRLLEALYRGELAHLDEGIGEILAALDAKGLTDSTLVVVTSDHGEGFDPARGRIHHGGRLHADLLRVPLLVAGPGVEPGATDQPVSLVDLMPTVLDALGLPVPPGLDGRSLAPWLAGERRTEPRTLYAMDHYLWWEGGTRHARGGARPKPLVQATLRGGLWYLRSPAGEELYADSDPEQRQNLIAGAPARLAALRALADARRPAAPAVERAADAEVEEELRALGYVR